MSEPRQAGTVTRWLNIKLRILRGLPDWNEHSILLWAAAAGAVGALATILFRETVHLIQLLFTQQQGGLVSAAMALPLWQRVLVPTVGALIAGYVLVLTRRLSGPRAAPDYMEAIAIGD